MTEESRRVSVQIYVTSHQRDQWDEDAESLEMSRSEFLRSMVQAGRRKFELSNTNDQPTESQATESGVDNDIDQQVLEIIRNDGPIDWDDLINELTDDLENSLENALSELQKSNIVEYNGRRGGYRLVEAEDES